MYENSSNLSKPICSDLTRAIFKQFVVTNLVVTPLHIDSISKFYSKTKFIGELQINIKSAKQNIKSLK